MRFQSASGHKATKRTLDKVFSAFMKQGYTTHTADGAVLASLLTRLQEEGVAYTLKFYPKGGGYRLERRNDG